MGPQRLVTFVISALEMFLLTYLLTYCSRSVILPSVCLSVCLSALSVFSQPTVTLTPTVTRARWLVYTVSGVYYCSRSVILPFVCLSVCLSALSVFSQSTVTLTLTVTPARRLGTLCLECTTAAGLFLTYHIKSLLRMCLHQV